MQPSLPMPKNSVSKSGSEETRESFITIDDLIDKALELFTGLKKLGEYKYPLDVRKAVSIKKKGKEVTKGMTFGDESTTVKVGSQTYFFDIKKTKEGKPYLVITESRFKGEGQDRERSSIMVFPEDAKGFLAAAEEMLGKLR